jgi:hypothetical protein
VSYAQQYFGRSAVTESDGKTGLRLSPNLARPRVFFQGELTSPVRFREAISALHEVVVGDLRFARRDKSAYRAYREALAREEKELAAAAADRGRRDALREAREPMPADLPKRFQRARKRYFDARTEWLHGLWARDRKLWWLLDPVITVAPDVVLFECFSKDESSYGCLTVDRGAFSHQDLSAAGLGTTNVDYSIELYQHLQTLRSYRPTELAVDPAGFEVQVTGHPEYREEKIDVPESWLRGFGQIQAAQVLPATRVRLGKEALYGLLAFLRRRREKTGPRAIRFELAPGRAPRVWLEPWDREIPNAGPPHHGEGEQTIRVWGRRRLLVLSRLMPLIDSVEVVLLGSGMPSVWVARMGELTFTLALSGWTTNDWTSGADLALLADRYQGSPDVVAQVRRALGREHRATLAELRTRVGSDVPERVLVGSLHELALAGQLIFDHAHGVYRHRPALPEPIAPGPPHPELAAARAAVQRGEVRIERHEATAGGRLLLQGHVGVVRCEALLDADGGFAAGDCSCSLFFRNKLRRGPCRHLLALRLSATAPRFGGKPTLVS